MVTIVSIELEKLKNWFHRLDNNQIESVTEELFDEIKRIEVELLDARADIDRKRKEHAAKMEALANSEPYIEMKTVMLNNRYRFRSTVSYQPPHNTLNNATVMVISKGRKYVSVKVIEPGHQFEGKVFNKVDINDLTTI